MLKKILSHSFWLLVANFIGKLSMFLINIIIVKVLSQIEFGEFSMIRNTITMIEGIISSTISSPIIKRVSEVSNNKSKFTKIVKSLFLINLILAIVFALLIILLSPYIVDTFFLSSKTLIASLSLGSLILISTAMSIFMQNIFIGAEEYKELSKSTIIASIFSFPVSVLLVYYYSLNGAIIGISVYFFIDFFVKYRTFRKLYLFKNEKIVPDILKREAKNLFSFSYPILISVLISSVAFWYVRVIIIESDGFEKIAIFNAAFQWLTIMNIISGSTTTIILPMLIRQNSSNKDYFEKILIYNILIALCISMAFAFIVIILSKEIMGLYGNTYIIGYNILNILSISSIFITLSSILNKVFISKSNMLDILFIITSGVFFMLILLKKHFLNGISGLAYSFLFFYMYTFIMYICIYLFRRRILKNV